MVTSSLEQMLFMQATLVDSGLTTVDEDFGKMCSFSLATWIVFFFYFCPIPQPYFSNLHSWIHFFFLKIPTPRTDKACRETWQLVRSDYDIKLIKFTSLPSILASIIYPINLRLKMQHMIPASLEVNLSGSLSRLNACYRIDCRIAAFLTVCHIFFHFAISTW